MREASNKPMMKLEKVIGLTTLSNASIVSRASDVYYTAGSIIVRYSPSENIQKSFYKASKAVSCVAASADGRYLAGGERGHSPNIIVWEVSTGEVIATINGTHKHGIGCLSFSPDARYLVSAGFKHDRQLIVWDWESLRIVSAQKLGNKVNSLCFHPSGKYFVTCGDRHLKWWYLGYSKKDKEGSIEVIGKPASILESHKNAVFMDIKIGHTDFVYCTTSTGLLCSFNETRFMDMWVQLESSVSYSLSLHTIQSSDISENIDVVIVGCTEGLVRVFSAKALQYLATLPLPVPSVGYTDGYPACLAICTVDGSTSKSTKESKSTKLAAIYSDHSIFIWDISDINNATQYRSFAYHRACIWDVQFITSTSRHGSLFPPGTFVTCSADNSIRIWSGEQKIAKRTGSVRTSSSSSSKPQYGDMLHMIEVSPKSTAREMIVDNNVNGGQNINNPNNSFSVSSSMATTVLDTTTDATSSFNNPSCGIPDLELPDRLQVPMAPRALAVHPSGGWFF